MKIISRVPFILTRPNVIIPTATSKARKIGCRKTHFKQFGRMTTSMALSANGDSIEGGGSPTRPSRKKRYKNRKRKNGKRSVSTNTDKSDPTSTTTSVAVTATATTVLSTKTGKKYNKNAAAMAVATAAQRVLSDIDSGPNNMSEDELAHDVSETFLHGPNGFFKEPNAKRQRLEEENDMFGNDPSHLQQMQYLRRLDTHPALVLNADYQVGCVCFYVFLLVSKSDGQVRTCQSN